MLGKRIFLDTLLLRSESKRIFLKVKKLYPDPIYHCKRISIESVLLLLPASHSLITWICGFCSRWKSSLWSTEMCVLVDSRSRTSMSMSIEFDSTGQNLSSLTLLRILLWTFTRAFSSFDCSSSLRNPNSSSVQLGMSDLLSCSEFSNLDSAVTQNEKPWVTKIFQPYHLLWRNRGWDSTKKYISNEWNYKDLKRNSFILIPCLISNFLA